ncbi:basic proline-rich protein-like [Lathamus discolor]|uniref:basic proline-rich protein-like n=1 Tax=Lathamus discolor TaxID=678569 RepID=UPI0032B7CFAD
MRGRLANGVREAGLGLRWRGRDHAPKAPPKPQHHGGHWAGTSGGGARCAPRCSEHPEALRSPGGGGRLHPAAAPPPSPDPDVGGTKRQRLGAPSSPDPDVGPLPAPGPRKDAGADGPHLAGSGGWGGAPLHLSPHREVRRQPDVAADGPGPDVGGPDNGAWLLAVDSDTDAEGEEPHPDVAAPPGGRPAVGPPHPGYRLLAVDSDTDVEEEEEGARPDVGPPESQL